MILISAIAVLAGTLVPACQSPGPMTRGSNPDLEGEATRLRSVMAAGSLDAAFKDITTVGFSERMAALVPMPEPSESDAPSETPTPPPAQPRTEREQLGAAIAEQIRARFTEAGYAWVDEGRPQRTIEFAWFLSESDGLAELDEMSRIAPGIPDVESLERGMLVLAVSWPGRAAPICRVSIDGVGRLGWPLKTKLESIPGSLERLLTGLPRGPVEPSPEPAGEQGPDSEVGSGSSPGTILGLDDADETGDL